MVLPERSAGVRACNNNAPAVRSARGCAPVRHRRGGRRPGPGGGRCRVSSVGGGAVRRRRLRRGRDVLRRDDDRALPPCRIRVHADGLRRRGVRPPAEVLRWALREQVHVALAARVERDLPWGRLAGDGANFFWWRRRASAVWGHAAAVWRRADAVWWRTAAVWWRTAAVWRRADAVWRRADAVWGHAASTARGPLRRRDVRERHQLLRRRVRARGVPVHARALRGQRRSRALLPAHGPLLRRGVRLEGHRAPPVLVERHVPCSRTAVPRPGPPRAGRVAARGGAVAPRPAAAAAARAARAAVVRFCRVRRRVRVLRGPLRGRGRGLRRARSACARFRRGRLGLGHRRGRRRRRGVAIGWQGRGRPRRRGRRPRQRGRRRAGGGGAHGPGERAQRARARARAARGF